MESRNVTPYSASIPGTVGTQSANFNYGELDTYGMELSVTWRDKIGKDFKYKVSVNTGYTDNKVLMMDWETNQRYMKIHEAVVPIWEHGECSVLVCSVVIKI